MANMDVWVLELSIYGGEPEEQVIGVFSSPEVAMGIVPGRTWDQYESEWRSSTMRSHYTLRRYPLDAVTDPWLRAAMNHVAKRGRRATPAADTAPGS